MVEVDPYWKDIVSMALRTLMENGDHDAVSVIRNSKLTIEFNNHDNWNGGIDYWDIVFELRYIFYNQIKEKKNDIEAKLFYAIDPFQHDSRNPIANVIVRPIIERFIDWQAVTPYTRESVIALIEEERVQLEGIATSQISFKDDDVADSFKTRHRQIVDIARKAGFDYPITVNTLEEWWAEIKNVGGYSDRRVYITRMFASLLEELGKDEDNPSVDFTRITTRSEIVKKAVDDAHMFIREGKYDSAIDRVHTAVHGYLRDMLRMYGVQFKEDDSIPALFSKLLSAYDSVIEPVVVAGRIKSVLRSAGGIMNAINELRNNNSVAHPNEQLIKEREAKLEIRHSHSAI